MIDGDTVEVLTPDKKQVRLRLASIDAPERGQPFGDTAKKFLSDLIFGKEIITPFQTPISTGKALLSSL